RQAGPGPPRVGEPGAAPRPRPAARALQERRQAQLTTHPRGRAPALWLRHWVRRRAPARSGLLPSPAAPPTSSALGRRAGKPHPAVGRATLVSTRLLCLDEPSVAWPPCFTRRTELVCRQPSIDG